MAPVEEKKVEKRGQHLKVPDHLKVPKKAYVPTGNPRGRKKGQTKVENRGKHFRKPDHLKAAFLRAGKELKLLNTTFYFLPPPFCLSFLNISYFLPPIVYLLFPISYILPLPLCNLPISAEEAKKAK